MKLKNIYSLFLILATLLCSGNVWGEPVEITPESPYTNNFNTETTYSLPAGWTKVAGNTYNPGIDSKNDWSGYTRNSSAKALFFYGNLSTGDQIVALPQFSDDIKYLTVDFYYKTKSSSYPANMSLGYITNLSNKSTYVSKSTLSYSSDGWTHVNYTFDENTPDGAYIAISFAGTSSTSSKKGLLSIEDVTVTTSYVAPTGGCAKPKNLTKSDDTPEGASFTWGQNTDETTYQWSCVASGTEVTSWNTLDENVRTKTVTGLTAGTAYDFHVRSYCGDGEGEQSASAKITFTPTCPAPTAPVVSGISATGATLSWTAAAGITDYQYCVVNAGSAANWENAILVEGATSAPLSGLTASTNYDVYVRSYYSATTQSAAVKASFQTACGAVTIPYEWDFATIGCWTTHNCHSSSGISSGAYSFHWADPGQYLISPEFDAISGTVDVTFDYKVQGSSYPETFALGYSTSTNDVSSFTWLSDETVTNTTYSQYAKTLPAGVKYVSIQCKSNQQYYLYIDNFSIEETPACPAPTITATNVIYNGATINCAGGSTENKWRLQYKAAGDADWTDANSGNLIAAASFDLSGLTPGTMYQAQAQAECEGAWSTAVSFTPNYVAPTGLTVTEATTTTATISWTANSGESSWTVQYKKSSDGEWTTVSDVTANPYILTGLTSGSFYQVKVAAGALYTAAVDFNTECEAKTIPFEENFDALNCWSMQNQVSNTGLYNNMFRFYYGYSDQYLISPELVASANQVQVEFKYYVYLGTETFHVGYSTTTNEISAFTWGDEIAATNTSALTYSETFPVGVKYIAIKYTSYDKYYLYIDNFSVTEYVAPSCAVPTALTIGEIGTTTASVLWTSEAAEFVLEYKKTSDEDWTAATGTIASPFALEGLTANETEYTVRVKAICGENNESEWVELAAPFKTDCAVKTVTEETAWTEDFEALTADQAPACFGEVSSYAMSAYTKVNAGAAKEGSLGLHVYVYGTNTEIALLPVFTEDAKNLKLSFDYKNQGVSSNYAALEVGYYTGSTFMNVVTLDKTDVFAASGEIVMPNDAPEGARIAFRVAGKKSGYNGSAYIDNISVIRKPACAVPTITAATATSDGAVVAWTPGDEESAWNLRHSVKDANVWTVVEDVTTGYAITCLTVGTTYEVQVQANCGGSQSAWTASANFTPVCNAPTALAVTARTQNSATFSWTSAESAWVLQYSTDGENWESENVAANPFTLSGLSAGTTYQAKIQAACGSEFSNIVNFTTWCAATSVLPLNEDFENIAVNALPACWEKISDGEYPGVVSGSAAYGGDGKCVCFFGVGTQILVLPAISAELADYKLSFFYKNNSASLELGYINNTGEFELLQTLENQTAYSDEAYTYALTNSLMNKNLAFRYVGTSAMSSHAYLDVVRISKPVVLADNVNNTATLAALNGQTVDVTIGRTITRTGYFNTICLPFDMPTLVGTPLEGAELWAFKYAKVENEELLFRIVEASSIEAGVPYFIQFAAGDAIVNPLFKNVTIAASAGQKVGDENMAQLCGILQPEIFTPGDQTKLFLYNENALYWWNGASASALNSFRAYFKVVTTGADAPARHNMPARLIKEEQQATGMESVQPSVISSQKILENGQVIIIRNGVKYSVQGQVIR